MGLQLDTGGAVLHLFIGRRRRPSLGQLFLALLQPGLGIAQPLLRLLQLFLQQGDLQLALLRLLVGGGQLPPQGLELLLLGLRLGLGRGDLLRLGRLGRLGFRQLPPDSLQLLPVLLVRRLNIIQHILLLKPAKGGRAELKFGVAHTAHPFSTESELFYHNSRYNTSATQTIAICTILSSLYLRFCAKSTIVIVGITAKCPVYRAYPAVFYVQKHLRTEVVFP